MYQLVDTYFWIWLLLFAVIQNRLVEGRLGRVDGPGVPVAKLRLVSRLFTAGLALPWLVWGIGVGLGERSSLQQMFEPPSGPFGQLWWASVFIPSWAIGGWLLFLGGARFLAPYSQAFFRQRSGPEVLRIYGLLMIVVPVVVFFAIRRMGT